MRAASCWPDVLGTKHAWPACPASIVGPRPPPISPSVQTAGAVAGQCKAGSRTVAYVVAVCALLAVLVVVVVVVVMAVVMVVVVVVRVLFGHLQRPRHRTARAR